MMTEDYVEILVKGSSGNVYTVRFYLGDSDIIVFCSCPAGENRKLCKHAFRVMNGDDSILGDNSQKEDFVKISNHIQKTPVPFLLSELNESEIALQSAESKVKRAKKALEKAVLGK